jgi:hypothetical protein
MGNSVYGGPSSLALADRERRGKLRILQACPNVVANLKLVTNAHSYTSLQRPARLEEGSGRGAIDVEGDNPVKLGTLLWCRILCFPILAAAIASSSLSHPALEQHLRVLKVNGYWMCLALLFCFLSSALALSILVVPSFPLRRPGTALSFSPGLLAWYGCAGINFPVLVSGPLRGALPRWLSTLSAMYLDMSAYAAELALVVLLGIHVCVLIALYREARISVRLDAECVLGISVWALSMIKAIVAFELGPGMSDFI